LLLTERVRYVPLGLLPRDPVHRHEVPEKLVASLSITIEKDVLDAVTVFAEGLETPQQLVARAFVELPDLVAMQPAFAAANLAAVSCPAVHRSAKAVPFATRHELGQAGQARTGWQGLDREAEVGHVRNMW